jgi:uncharacterized LabA/DUF88 family protein
MIRFVPEAYRPAPHDRRDECGPLSRSLRRDFLRPGVDAQLEGKRQMTRFVLFVDGPNLFGSLKAMNLEVHDYEPFYAYLFREARGVWREVTQQDTSARAQLQRIYWYQIGTIDEWDLSLPQSQIALRSAFNRDRTTHDMWMQQVGRDNVDLKGAKLEDRAWAACFADFRSWYEAKRNTLAGMRRFYQGVRGSTDLIDVVDTGHWKVDFIRKSVNEKGVDTSLAVDMVALQESYDVAVLVSGDADSIPSIRYVKNRNKHVAAVEFVNGSPPEARGRSFSSRLKEHADFVARVYETELLRQKFISRPNVDAGSAVAAAGGEAG